MDYKCCKCSGFIIRCITTADGVFCNICYDIFYNRKQFTSITLDPKKSVGSKKLSFSNLPVSFLVEVARAINTGAEKYGRYNWQKSDVELLTYINAILRHCLLMLAGQDRASDSGLYHTSHIAATCAVIDDARVHGTLKDNRDITNQDVIQVLEAIINDPTKNQ